MTAEEIAAWQSRDRIGESPTEERIQAALRTKR